MIGISLVRKAALAGTVLAGLQLSGCMAQPMGHQSAGCYGPCLTQGYVAPGYQAPVYQAPGYYYGQAVPTVVESHTSIPVSQYAIEPYASMAAHGGQGGVAAMHAGHGVSTVQSGAMYSGAVSSGVMHTGGMQSGHSALVSAPSGGMHMNPGSAYSMTSDVVVLTQSDCPAGTMLQSNGTCLQGGSSAYTSTGSSAYTTGSYTTGSTSMAACPAGTTMQGNGTCMSSSYSSGSSVTMYGTGGGMAQGCPAGTTAQSNGTCMQTSTSYSSGGHGGYQPIPGKSGHYYRPVKK